jgi:formate dehydrogenase maturation protein FdhE
VPLDGALLAFDDLTLEWSDFRFVLRATAEILRRADILDAGAHRRLLDLSREAGKLEPLVRRFYEATARTIESPDDDLLAETGQVFLLALRPFLSRAAEAVFRQMDFGEVVRRSCPLCGMEPDFAVLTVDGTRNLVCGGCRGRWPFDPVACPFCGNDDRVTLVSRTSADHQYRLDGCDMCRRYIKAYDEAVGGRPALLSLDAVATLSLDAAAMQQGYR